MDLKTRFHKMDASLLNRYMQSNTSEDFQRWKIFPNVKEVMESFACLRALESKVPVQLDGKMFMVVGDGVKPRTALTMAYFGRFDRRTCRFVSLDPNMRAGWSTGSESVPQWVAQTKELSMFRDKAERWAPDDDDMKFIRRDIIIVAPHSHAPLLEVVHNLKKHGAEECHVLSLPCCVDDTLGPPDLTWCDKDLHQHTPKSTFNYYHLK